MEIKKVIAQQKNKMQPKVVHLPCGEDVVLTPMTVESYKKVRELLPGVSRCFVQHSPEVVEAMVNNPSYYPICAFRNDELVGFAELHLMPHIGRCPDSRLERVVVSENFRGKGLATVLCQEIIAFAKTIDCGRVELTVEKDAARHIYEDKLKFSKVDTTVMRLMLDD
eukprot:Selendium_serpulae@DN5436_c0_g1_i2.p1